MVTGRNGKIGATSLAGVGMMLAGTFAMVLAGLGVSTAGATQPDPEHQVRLCHRTDSYSNPYEEFTVDVASVLETDGHDSHTGPVFFPDIPKGEKWGDIIPPFDFGPGEQYAGKNFDADGQAIWNAGCTVASTTTTTGESTPTTEASTTTSTTVGSTTTAASTTTTTKQTTETTSSTTSTTGPGTPTSASGTTTPVTGEGTPESSSPVGGVGTTSGVDPGATDNGSGSLPFTGSPVAMLVGLGLALIASGLGLIVRRRRNAAA